MGKYIDSDIDEEKRFVFFLLGKTIKSVTLGFGDITLEFTDGSTITVSHLGGLEIESINGVSE